MVMFEEKPTYDDNGALSVSSQDILPSATFTFLDLGLTYTAGSILSMYDSDVTTYFSPNTGGNSTTTWMKWNLQRKLKIKNVYVYLRIDNTPAAPATRTVKLEGSNDNSAWTTIATASAPTGTNYYYNILATSISYKYLRLYAGDGQIGWFVYNARAVI